MKEFRKSFSILFPYIRKQRKAYSLLVFFMLFDIALTLAFAWFLGNIADAAADRRFDRLQWLVPLGAGFAVLGIVSSYISNHFEFAAAHAAKKELKERLFKHTLLLPARRINSLRSGEFLTYFTQDIHGIHGLIGGNLIQLIRLPVIFIAVFIYMFQIHWMLSLLSLAVAPAAALAGAAFGIVLRKNSRAIHQSVENINNLLSESFQGMQVIRSFTMEKRLFSRFSRQNGELYGLELKNTKLRGWFYGAGQAAGSVSFLVSLSVGAYFVSDEFITIGALLAFVNLNQQLVYPLTGLAELWAGFQRSLSAVERISKVLEEPAEIAELPSYFPPGNTPPAIEFRDVTFAYEGQTRLFEHLNLVIPAGATVAVVGASGAGKSTLLSLIQGLYPPQSGSILVGGVPVQGFSPSEIRSSMACVSQETFLFSGTIRDNLALARPGAAEEELVQAAVRANIHDFILTLPNGYDTEVGERGVYLSGGQRQRLAIARALLKDAPILLLDEATSSLDTETEHQVKQALNCLMAQRTTVVIAHRLSTIRDADLIVVLDKGRIVQMGRHEELAKRCGVYRNLHRIQSIESERIPLDHQLHSNIV